MILCRLGGVLELSIPVEVKTLGSKVKMDLFSV